MYRTAGDGQTGGSLLFLQLQMLLPAFSAILLGRWVLAKEYVHSMPTATTRNRAFFSLVFIIFTLGYAALVAWWLLEPEAVTTINAVSGAWNMLGLILLLAVRFLSNGEEFAAIGLKGGKLRDWFLWGIAFVAFYALQAVLNSLLIKGAVRVDLGEVITQIGFTFFHLPASLLAVDGRPDHRPGVAIGCADSLRRGIRLARFPARPAFSDRQTARRYPTRRHLGRLALARHLAGTQLCWPTPGWQLPDGGVHHFAGDRPRPRYA